MAGEAYSFSTGAIQCTPVSDASCPFLPSVFFANVPQRSCKLTIFPGAFHKYSDESG